MSTRVWHSRPRLWRFAERLTGPAGRLSHPCSGEGRTGPAGRLSHPCSGERLTGPAGRLSFFIGRDVEYLKAPSDAVKVSAFSDVANLDVVYTPSFNADRYISGRRISYYNGDLGRRAGRDAIVDPKNRNDWFTDDEIAARVYRDIGGYELAAYGYDGYWKSPAGKDPAANRATFPRLAVYGASVRGNVLSGIGNVEFGWYDSLDDRAGDDPNVPNSQLHRLLGYKQDIARNLTLGLQYYVEHMLAYGNYRGTLPADAHRADRNRQVVTMRLTQLLMKQNLTLSLFVFYSPTDADGYLRPRVNYKIGDHWQVETGANLFFGRRDYTFFGQYERDANVYVGARYSF